MWQQIEEALSRALGEPFTARERRPLGGGCINEAFRVQGRDRTLFIKLNSADGLEMFSAEAAGLAAILASASV
ncbi:MAG: fructosamine kinase family protein, partial [Pseudomonadales bacterium]|nr:fructosamine kinase family protein [Pseudomonadales bacterium]